MCANKSLGSGNTFGFLQQKQKMYKMIESVLGKRFLDFFVDVEYIILCVKSTIAGKDTFFCFTYIFSNKLDLEFCVF